MTISSAVYLLIQPLAPQGEQLFGKRWPELSQLLEIRLHRARIEQKGGGELLIFSFAHPYPALAALFESFTLLKKELEPPEESALPFRIILRLAHPKNEAAKSPLPAFDYPWESLRPETLHITSSLRLHWEKLMADSELAPHSFAPVAEDLFLVTLTEQNFRKRERLFTNRELPLTGKHGECFYCGMTLHQPASCPSKLLYSQQEGLSLVGYLPLAELNNLYGTVLTEDKELLDKLMAGVKNSQIRQDEGLQTFLAFFDLNRIYQLRTLYQVAFSFFTDWDSLRSIEEIKITNRNLHLALDCLRVGQYRQAEKLFENETLRHRGNQFCALVGQGFAALEQGREKDMESFFLKAASQAGQEKEQVYIHLLLSRYYDLRDDRWKAAHALDTILALNRSLPDALYRKFLLQAKIGSGEQDCPQLRSLVTGKREQFMVVLMDPALLPIQGLVEDLLSAQLLISGQEAKKNLDRATAECNELRGWFEPEEEAEEELHQLLRSLAGLESRYNRWSYYDFLDVATRADRLYHHCHRLREAKLDLLKRQLAEVVDHWDGFQLYWSGYPYQFLFSQVKEKLAAAGASFETARNLFKEVSGETYRAARNMVLEAETKLELLKPLLTKMAWAKIGIEFLGTFAKKLLVTELLLLTVGLTLFFLFHFVLADKLPALPSRLLAEPWFLKQTFSVITLLIAPLLALTLTLWEMTERR